MTDISEIIQSNIMIRQGYGDKINFRTSIENYEKLKEISKENKKAFAGNKKHPFSITNISADLDLENDLADVELSIYGVPK